MSTNAKNHQEPTQYRLYEPQHPKLVLLLHLFGTLCVCCFFAGCVWFMYKTMRTESVERVIVDAIDPQVIAANKPQGAIKAVEFIELPAANVDTGVRSGEWMLRQNGQQFTIQLASSVNKERLYKDAETFDSVDPVSFYPFRVNGDKKTVYGFACGIYNSLEEARTAIATQPEVFKQYGPWIRPIGEIQTEIQDTGAISL